MTAPETARRGLAPLVWPIYVPSFVYAAGASALLPAQVLLALQLGFGPAGVAAIVTWIGAFAIVASFSAGYIVTWLGEHRAVVAITALGALGLVATWLAATLHLPGARWVMVGALTLIDLVDAVWSIARQGLVADLAPSHLRGRAMNLYGACQRMGRVVGPLLAAAILAVTGPAVVFPAAAVVICVATVILLRRAVRPAAEVATGASAAEPERDTRELHRALRALAILGIGVLVLTALRTAKETLLPLWAARAVRLPDATVALIMGATSAMELVLFWPAGVALDRWGRAPVLVTAMLMLSGGLALVAAHADAVWLVAGALLVGLGDGVGAGIIKTLGTDLAPKRQRGRFLGWWQSVASAGSLLAPAVAGALIAAASLRAALVAIAVIGVVGAAWMAFWTPRYVPRRREPM